MSKTDPLLTALRDTAASFGWQDRELVIDTTALRLAGPDADGNAVDDLRERLCRVWAEHIDVAGVA